MTHSEYVMLTVYTTGNNGYANATQCYVYAYKHCVSLLILILLYRPKEWYELKILKVFTVPFPPISTKRLIKHTKATQTCNSRVQLKCDGTR